MYRPVALRWQKKRMKAPTMDYAGFHPASKEWKPNIVSSLKELQACVQGREPCLIAPELLAPLKIPSLSQLQQACQPGPCMVQVEEPDSLGNFGAGTKRTVDFTLWDLTGYLTTQYDDDETRHQFLSPPLNSCASLVPKLWKLTPALVPHQVTLWLGSGSNTCSGLHHE